MSAASKDRTQIRRPYNHNAETIRTPEAAGGLLGGTFVIHPFRSWAILRIKNREYLAHSTCVRPTCLIFSVSPPQWFDRCRTGARFRHSRNRSTHHTQQHTVCKTDDDSNSHTNVLLTRRKYRGRQPLTRTPKRNTTHSSGVATIVTEVKHFFQRPIVADRQRTLAINLRPSKVTRRSTTG